MLNSKVQQEHLQSEHEYVSKSLVIGQSQRQTKFSHSQELEGLFCANSKAVHRSSVLFVP